MTRRGKDPDEPRHMPSLDAAGLERLALAYVGRYATTRAKLAAYLRRKIGERGWAGQGNAPIEALVARCATLGYVDDRQFAEAKAAALGRRGYGVRRVSDALRAAGIAPEDAAPIKATAGESARETAIAFARKRRFGPFAPAPMDPDKRRRALAAMLRAGHAHEISRRVIEASPGDLEDFTDPHD